MKKIVHPLTAILATVLSLSATAQNVGIGTTAPVNRLQIGITPGFSDNDLAIGNGAQGMSFFQGTGVSTWFSNVNFSLMPNGSGGNVGIGTQAPINKLQIGATPSFSGNDLAIGNGAQGMSFFQGTGASTWFSNVNFSLMPNGGGGKVGIGTQTPVNTLQIGSVGASGYNGNQIAFGNGTQASGIAQTATAAQWYSTTDIVLMPSGNGHGRVGINTASPQFPLDVEDFVQTPQPLGGYSYFKSDLSGATQKVSTGYCVPCTANVSIYAAQNVYAQEFDAYSDARIKDIVGVSNSAKDYQTLNAIKIMDYTLKDKVKNGNKPFKKVIAQQVETVYPQLISKHVDFIPNVYQEATTVTRTDKGLLLKFDGPHHISQQATKIRILVEGNHKMDGYDILSIPSDHEVLIDAPQLIGDRIFVYGEQVDDFRTVDYEGLTTLNVSATQELSKIVRRQQAAIRAQNKKIAALSKRLEALTNHKSLN